MSVVRPVGLLVAVLGLAPLAVAQPTTPMFQNVGQLAFVNGGAYTSGTVTGTSTAAAGANPGYTQFTYGSTSTPGLPATLVLNGTAASPTVITYFTNNPSNPSQNPNTFLPNFNPYMDSFSLTIFAPVSSPAPSTSTLLVRTNEGAPATYAPAGTGAATTARLNQILVFDPSNFRVADTTTSDPNDSVPIASLPGFNLSDQFSFSYTAGNTGVALNYTPIPEPGLLFGLAAVGLAGLRQVRRRV